LFKQVYEKFLYIARARTHAHTMFKKPFNIYIVDSTQYTNKTTLVNIDRTPT